MPALLAAGPVPSGSSGQPGRVERVARAAHQIINPFGPNIPPFSPSDAGAGMRAYFTEMFKEGTALNFITKVGIVTTVGQRLLMKALKEAKNLGVESLRLLSEHNRAATIDEQAIIARELLRSLDDDPAGQGVVADVFSRVDP